MTTRTMPEHEARCRQLAELHTNGERLSDRSWEIIPDPRFASLRGDLSDAMLYMGAKGYQLRTDGDALDEAIAACGYDVRIDKYEGTWTAYMTHHGTPKAMVYESQADGATPREAKSAALWQAVIGDTQ